MAKVLIKRGTRAQLDAAATANQLAAGELYLMTDAQRLAVGTAAGNYAEIQPAGWGIGQFLTNEEKEVAQVRAVCLEPDAIEPLQVGTFTYTASPSQTKFLLGSWQTKLGSTGRFELRNPQRPFPLRDVSLVGTGSDSFAMLLNPGAIVYDDPWSKYYVRRALLNSLPTKALAITASSQSIPMLPGAYGAIITSVTCFNLAWLVLRIRYAYGLNLWDEISDAAIQRIGDSLFIPVSKAVAGDIESSSTSSSTGGAASGAVTWVLLPSDWSEMPDPVSSSYLFRDDFMGAALDAGVWTRTQSTTGNVEISTTYQWCKLFGNSAWGTNGLYRTTTISRSLAPTLVVDVYCPRGASATGLGIVGWSTATNHQQSGFAHGVNFAGGSSPGGIINIYENGTNRGTVGVPWKGGCIYRVKIVANANGSATYSIQGDGYADFGSASWTSINPGTSSSGTNDISPGAAAWASTMHISDMRVF